MVLSNTLDRLLDTLEAREHMLERAQEAHAKDDWAEVNAILLLLTNNKAYEELIEEVRSFALVNK